MKILNDLIEDPAGDKSLSAILMKAKVFAHQLKVDPLKSWIDFELNGYTGNEPLPAYRVLPCSIFCDIMVRNVIFRGRAISLSKTAPEFQDLIQNMPIRTGISFLEKIEPQLGLTVFLTPDIFPYLSGTLRAGAQIVKAWQFTPGQMGNQVIISAKSKLLDFLLALQDELNDASNEEIASKHQGILGLFNRTVFGDNTTIIIGTANSSNKHAEGQ